MADTPKILYVDDEEINVFLFKHNFSENYDILTANSGMEGLDLLETHVDIQFVISDMNMPEMSGMEFISKAKALYPNKNYYILAGYDFNEDIQEALDQKLIKKYFKKPLDPEALITELSESLANS
jgi:response regulator RpfG family c-di-GMP phosphodiesterase